MSKPHQKPPFIVKSEHILPLDDHNLENLYIWLDKIPLSRPKKNLTRDFSDGVLCAEIIKYFLPKYVQLHNFTPSGSSRHKENNWFHMNRKVLNQLRLEISHEVIHDIANCKPWVMEHVLCVVRNRIEDESVRLHALKHQLDAEFKDWMKGDNDQDYPEVDQAMNTGNGTKSGFHSLDDFYMSHGLKLSQNPQDYQILPEISQPSPRHKPFKPLPQEMVPKTELDQRVETCQDKQEIIDTLHRKIKRLENFVHLKDIRIQDMSERMLTLQDQFSGPGDYMEPYHSPRAHMEPHPSPRITGRRPQDVRQKPHKSPVAKRKFNTSQGPPRRVAAGGGTTRR